MKTVRWEQIKTDLPNKRELRSLAVKMVRSFSKNDLYQTTELRVDIAKHLTDPEIQKCQYTLGYLSALVTSLIGMESYLQEIEDFEVCKRYLKQTPQAKKYLNLLGEGKTVHEVALLSGDDWDEVRKIVHTLCELNLVSSLGEDKYFPTIRSERVMESMK